MKLNTHNSLARTLLVLVASGTLFLAGCNNAETPTTGDNGGQTDNGDDDDGHDHPDHGPHDGDLIEFGDDTYHGELVHDKDAGTVTVYVLDGEAKKVVPVKAESVMINITHDDMPEQYTLEAKPEEGEADGTSSRYVSEDTSLGDHLHHDKDKAELVLKIDGKSYSGKIEHDHDH